MRSVVVIAATRQDGTVGYFKTAAEVPSDFRHPGNEEINTIMASMRLDSVDRCLEIMNQHWQEPVLGPRCPETYEPGEKHGDGW